MGGHPDLFAWQIARIRGNTALLTDKSPQVESHCPLPSEGLPAAQLPTAFPSPHLGCPQTPRPDTGPSPRTSHSTAARPRRVPKVLPKPPSSFPTTMRCPSPPARSHRAAPAARPRPYTVTPPTSTTPLWAPPSCPRSRARRLQEAASDWASPGGAARWHAIGCFSWRVGVSGRARCALLGAADGGSGGGGSSMETGLSGIRQLAAQTRGLPLVERGAFHGGRSSSRGNPLTPYPPSAPAPSRGAACGRLPSGPAPSPDPSSAPARFPSPSSSTSYSAARPRPTLPASLLHPLSPGRGPLRSEGNCLLPYTEPCTSASPLSTPALSAPKSARQSLSELEKRGGGKAG